MLRFLITGFIVLALLLHNLPYLIRDQAVLWLLNNGADKAGLKSISINWFQGMVELKELSVQAEGRDDLSLGRLKLQLDYAELGQKRVRVNTLDINQLRASILQQKDELWLGPIGLHLFTSKETAKEKENTEPSEWSYGLDQLTLTAIDWKTTLPGQSHRLQVRSGRVADFYLWDYTQPVSLDLEGTLNGAPISLNSVSKPLPEVKHSELTLKLKGFPVHSATALFVPSLRASADLDLVLSVEANAKTGKTRLQPVGSISLKNLSYQDEKLKLKNKHIRWQGELNLAMAGGKPELIRGKSRLTLGELSLGLAETAVELNSLNLSAALQSKGLEEVLIKDLELDLEGAALKHKQQQLDIDALTLAGEIQSADLQQWNLSLPVAEVEKLTVTAMGDELVSLNKLALTKVAVANPENVTIGSIGLQSLQVQGDGGVFSQWNSIALSEFELLQLNQLNLGAVSLAGSSTRIFLSEQRKLTDLEWLLQRLLPPQQAEAEEKQTSSEGEPFNFRIGQVSLTGDNQLGIRDAAVKPAFTTQLQIDQLQLENLDSRSKGKTAFTLSAKNKFSSIKTDGAIELFSGNYGGHWSLDIKGLELPQVSPYSLQYTGYYLHSGQMNLSSEGKIEGRQLKGDSDIRLNKLRVEAQDQNVSGEFDQKVSMPLETAIMVLQDNDDNIDLQIPVDGSLDDPQFGYQTVINKLAGKGVKSAAMGYLTKALQPFGALISIAQMAMDAKEKGSFITLQPVYFSAAENSLSSDAKAYIAKLAGMLNERKAMRINICGMAVAADQDVVWARLQESNKAAKKPLPEEQLKAQLEPAMLALAQQRSDVIKAALSERHKISIERLFSCYPKIDLKAELKPQASLGL